MRQLGKRIQAMARRHTALTVALMIVAVVIAGGVSLAGLSGAFTARAPIADTYTFTADWTLLDLERHIQAGEVATISVVAAPSTAASSTVTDVLAARTASGQWIRVTLAVTPSDALVALRSLGFGRLIAVDSVAQLPASYGLSGSGSGPQCRPLFCRRRTEPRAPRGGAFRAPRTRAKNCSRLLW